MYMLRKSHASTSSRGGRGVVVNATSIVSIHIQQSIRCAASLGDSIARYIRTAVVLHERCNVLSPGVEVCVGGGVGSAGQSKTVTWRKLEYGHKNVWGRAGTSKSYADVKRHYI